jgi:hypothetical protein
VKHPIDAKRIPIYVETVQYLPIALSIAPSINIAMATGGPQNTITNNVNNISGSPVMILMTAKEPIVLTKKRIA